MKRQVNQYGGIKMLWTEKYRPNKLNEIIGQEHFTLDAKGWIEENNMPNVLLYGNPRKWKTGAGLVIAKEILKIILKITL